MCINQPMHPWCCFISWPNLPIPHLPLPPSTFSPLPAPFCSPASPAILPLPVSRRINNNWKHRSSYQHHVKHLSGWYWLQQSLPVEAQTWCPRGNWALTSVAHRRYKSIKKIVLTFSGSDEMRNSKVGCWEMSYNWQKTNREMKYCTMQIGFGKSVKVRES